MVARVEVIRHVVARYFEAVRAVDTEAWVATFAPDAVTFDPAGTEPVSGRAQLREFFGSLTSAFERVALHEDNVFVSEDGAAVKWTGHAIAKDGRDVTFEGINVFEVTDDGRIQTLWGYWDPQALESVGNSTDRGGAP